MTDHEQQAETGTGWPDAAAEPTDTGWPESATAPAATGRDAKAGGGISGRDAKAGGGPVPDAVAADVTETPEQGETDLVGRTGAGNDETVDLGRARPPQRPGGGTGPRWQRLTSAGALVGVLTALLGFGLAVQLRSHTADPALASARQEDLVRILSDLEAREERTRLEIADLEERQRQLTSGALGRKAALREATQRADELGILAGTLPAEGPGLIVRFDDGREPVRAERLLDAIQELRGAGAEAMQIAGGDGPPVRIVASTYVVDADGGVEMDKHRLSAPYTITAIGDGQTMRTALGIPGGVVESVRQDGGNVTVQDPGTVQVTALHAATPPRYAHPAK